MLRVVQGSNYFLSKDPERTLFKRILTHRSGRDFYEGNERLKEYLRLAQNIYIAKTGCKLFYDFLDRSNRELVETEIGENFDVLMAGVTIPLPEIPTETKGFLDRLYRVLENASLDELNILFCEDVETDREMSTMENIRKYSPQYHDIICILDRMEL